MRKVVSVFLILLTSILLIACGGDKKPEVDPDIATVATAKAALEIGFKGEDNKDSVTQDVTLKTSGEDGVTISWATSKASIISRAGRVNRPIVSDEEVTLTATLTKNDVQDSKEFKLKVIKLEVDPTTPVIEGVETYVELVEGEDYDPLDGVTAKSLDVDVTDSLETTFDAVWLETAGTYHFEITAKSATTDAVGKIEVDLIVTPVIEPIIVGPEALTHYVGSRTLNLLEEYRAFYIDEFTGEEIESEVFIHTKPVTTSLPGTYPYKIGTKNNRGEDIVYEAKLTVKAAKQGILAELPKGTADNPTKIELWHSNGTTIEDALKSYAKTFETVMRAAGFHIKIDITKNGSTYDELKTNVINAGKGGTLPNIVQNYPDHVVEYNANGYIESLQPYMFHPVHGYQENNPEEKFLDILEGYRAEQRATNLQGEYISLPFNKSTEVLSYNKDLFDEVLEGRPFPSTWQDLFALTPEINKVKDKHIDKIAQRWEIIGKPLTAEEIQKAKDDFVPFVYDSSANAFITLTRQFGGQYTSRKPDGKGQLDFDNAGTREMLEFFGQASIDKKFTVPARWEAGYANEVTKHGKAVAGIGSTGGLRYNTPVEDGYKLFNLGVAPVPYDKFNPELRTVIQQGTNMSMTTQGTEAQKLLSWYFIKYLTSAGVQTAFAVETGYSPVRESVYTSELYKEYLSLANIQMEDSFAQMKDPDTGSSMTVAEYTALYELVVKAMGSRAATLQRKYQFTDTPFVGSSGTRDAVGVTFDRVMLKDPLSTLEKAINDGIEYGLAEASKGIPK